MVGLFRRLVALADRATRLRFALALVGALVVSVAEVLAVIAVLPLMTLVTGQSSDVGALRWLSELLGHPADQTLAAWIAGLVFLGFLVKGITAMAIRWWTLGFVNRQGVHTAAELLSYYLRAPLSLHLRRSSADLLRTMNDATGQVYSQIVVGGMAALTELITIVVMAITLLVIAPVPAVLVLIYLGVASALLQLVVRQRAVRAGEQLVHAAYVTTRTALHALGGIKEIKLRHLQDSFTREYARAREQSGQALRMTAFLTDLPKYTMELLFISGIALTTALIYARSDPAEALGILAVFAVAGFRLLPSAVRLIASISSMRSGAESLTLVERDLTAARELASHTRPPAGPVTLDHALELCQVHFRYNAAGDDVLRGIDLTVPAGSSLALVGPSGAGKSTLVDIILGLHSPTSGSVRADGVDVVDRMRAWQDKLAMVPQDVFLVDGSIADNVVFDPDATVRYEERLQQVVDQAELRSLVDSVPEGVELSVGERGSRLSGGQRQRVGIARALYRQPRLLVLDEATSALDNETEHQITDTMAALRGEITVIVVAHRLSTVRDCDQIAYLVDGAVVEVGTFDELRRRSSGFARLVELASVEGARSSAPAPSQGRLGSKT